MSGARDLQKSEVDRLLLAEAAREEGQWADIKRARDTLERAGRDRSSLRDYQRAALRAQLSAATESVPAYRDLKLDRLAAMTDPFDALARLPILDKATLRQRLPDYCSDEIDVETCTMSVTSGTTGVPVTLVHDRIHQIQSAAAALNQVAGWGLPDRRRILLPCQARYVGWFSCTSAARAYSEVARFGLPTGDEAHARELVQRSRRYEPEALFAHPTHVLDYIAALQQLPGPVPRPLAVICFGETLTPTLAERIRGFFNCPVRDMIGLREFGTIAATCVAGTYHVESERCWIEVVNPATGTPLPEGEYGEMVVTALDNRVMPLLRYRTGDFVRLVERRCGCGKPHKAIEDFSGRDPGRITLRDGRSVDALTTRGAIRGLPVDRFQMVNTAPGELKVLVTPSVEAAEAADVLIESVGQAAAATLDGSVRVSVVLAGPEKFIRSGPEGKVLDFIGMVTKE